MTLSTEKIDYGQKIKASAIFDKAKGASILSKHYDAKPELEVGKWVIYKPSNKLRFITNLEDGYADNLELSGESNGDLCEFYKPHIFTEKDLELLNTDEVKYELRGNDKIGFSTKKVASKPNNYYKTLFSYHYQTAHEAIESIANAVLAENLRLRTVEG